MIDEISHTGKSHFIYSEAIYRKRCNIIRSKKSIYLLITYMKLQRNFQKYGFFNENEEVAIDR